MNSMMTEILSGKKAFCLIQKQDSEEILVLLGQPGQYEYLNDIPRKYGAGGDRRCYDSISIIPFCQIKERGFEVHDKGEKIRTIVVEKQTTLFKKDLLRFFPDRHIHLKGNIEYDATEAEYAEIIRRVVTDEIGEGEGANFVIPRNGRGCIDDFTLASACGLFTALMQEDYGTYWKYLFYDGTRFFIGSTPERHLLVERGRVKMNPISGTFRKGTSPYELATLDGLEELAAIRSENFIGYQFHPESILTKNGQVILCRSIEHLMAGM